MDSDYGTRRRSSLVMRDVVLTGISESRSCKAYASEHIDAAIPIKQMIDQRIQVEEAAEHVPGETSATIGAMISVLCVGDDGAYYNLVRRIPLSFEAGAEVPTRVKTEIQLFDVTAPPSGGLDVEISATVSAGEEKARRVAMVDAVEWPHANHARSLPLRSSMSAGVFPMPCNREKSFANGWKIHYNDRCEILPAKRT